MSIIAPSSRFISAINVSDYMGYWTYPMASREPTLSRSDVVPMASMKRINAWQSIYV